MNKKKLILTWNIDDAKQDGYLHTRSFPISQGDRKEFNPVIAQNSPIVILIDNFESYAIVAISRPKYPGELSSIKKGSKHQKVLEDVLASKNYLRGKNIIGFSNLYRKLLNITSESDTNLIKIRKGIKLELYTTDEKHTYLLVVKDNKLNSWRLYRQNDACVSLKSVEAREYKKVNAAMSLSLRDLKEKINKKSQTSTKRRVYVEKFTRNPLVVAFALKRSRGRCELCRNKAPFIKNDGTFYLEVHHIIPLSISHDDSIINTAALCPNCHRMLHYGEDRLKKRDYLKDKVALKNS